MLSLDPLALTAALDAAATAVQQAAGAPAGLAYVARGGVTVTAATGVADLATGAAARADQAFEIGSQTKMMTAATVLSLVAEGRIDLDARAAGYLPAATIAGIANAETATLRQLLTHSAGIVDCDRVLGQSGLPVYVEQVLAAPDQVFSVDRFLDIVRGLPAEFPAGAASGYSNTGFLLLQKIIEQVTGQPLAAVMQARIFGPAGMADTRLDDFLPHGPRWASYAQAPDGSVVDVTPLRVDSGGDGGVVSTAADLARFFDALLVRKTLLPDARLAAMLTPFLAPGETPGPSGYGLGIDLEDVTGVPPYAALGPLAGHTGGTLGTVTLSFAGTETGIAFGAAANGRLGDQGAYSALAFQAVAGTAAALLEAGALRDPTPGPLTQLGFASGSAADLRLVAALHASELALFGVTVRLDQDLAAIADGDVRFADGSVLLVGDGTTGTVADALDNRLDILLHAPAAALRDNQLLGLDGNDTLAGGQGRDLLLGGEGRDSLLGRGGGDTLDGGAGADTMAGGAGNDTYGVDDAGDRVIEAPGGGIDTVRASVSVTLWANVENLVLTGSATLRGAGNALDNRLTANDAGDQLAGYDGRDTLLGGAGNDSLNGGAGADSMAGGAGNDSYVVDNAGDLVAERPGEGTDLVQASIGYRLGADVENLVLTGTAAIDGTGNALANLIRGNDGANRLSGGAGADSINGGAGDDTLLGGGGNDLLTGGAGRDLFRFDAPGEGGDRILDFTAGVDRIGLSAAGFGIGGGLVLSQDHATGGAAQLVYRQASGALSWDADGAGAGSAVLLAWIIGKPALMAADFLLS
ncbi:MAG: serine hydrolase [Paracraurococcus sp.]